jgi:hypothetical protein
MTRLKLFVTMVCAIGLVGVPAGASAQDLPIGKAVHVTNLDGSRIGGTLVSLDGKAVVIDQRKGAVTIPLTGVRRVERDSYAVPIGLGVGFGAGLVSGLALCANGDDCAPGLTALMFGGIGAGIGTAAGFAIKSSRTNTRTVYRAPTKTSIAMTPVLGRRQVGVRGVIAW